MANSRDFEELLYTWRSWRDNIGHEIRPKYIKYMGLVNEAATSIGIYYLSGVRIFRLYVYCICYIICYTKNNKYFLKNKKIYKLQV